MTLEKTLREEVIQYLNDSRIFHFRLEDANLSNYPDIVICHRGLFIAVELKRDTKTKARKGQLKVLKDIEKAGGIAGVVGDLNMLKELIEFIDDVGGFYE